jgi:replicative DNA helicase
MAVWLSGVRAAFKLAQVFDQMMQGPLFGTEGGVAAVQALQGYSRRLYLCRSSGAETDIEAMRLAVETIRGRTGQAPFVVVDYLIKVQAAASSADRRRPARPSEHDRISEVVEGLKDVALDPNVLVLGLAAVDNSGLSAATRTRVQDLRGSSALTHEADVVLILNNKFDVVARHHLMYNLANAAQFHSWVVQSIEKHRNGVDNVDLKFRKHFEDNRFEPDRGRVQEELVDELGFLK